MATHQRHPSTVYLTVGLPLPNDAVRLMVTTAGGTRIMAPDAGNSFTLILSDGQDYYITLLINTSVLTRGAKGKRHYEDGEENMPESASNIGAGVIFRG